MPKPSRSEAYVVAIVTGLIAVAGSYFVSREAFRQERALREDDRVTDTRTAARVLDLELFNRARLALSTFGLDVPPGDIKRASVLAAWTCVGVQLAVALDVEPAASPECSPPKPVAQPDGATRLTVIAWPLEERHALASRVEGTHWFRITVAVESWAAIADRHATVGELARRAQRDRRTASDVVEAVDALARARAALGEYVGLASSG